MLIFPIQFRFSSVEFCFKMHCLLVFGIILSPSKKNSHAEKEKKTGLKRKGIKYSLITITRVTKQVFISHFIFTQQLITFISGHERTFWALGS